MFLHSLTKSVAGRHLGAGATALLTDADRLTTLIAGLSVLALGVYSAREGTRAAGRAFDRSAPALTEPLASTTVHHCNDSSAEQGSG